MMAPTAAVDIGAKAEIYHLIRKLARERSDALWPRPASPHHRYVPIRQPAATRQFSKTTCRVGWAFQPILRSFSPKLSPADDAGMVGFQVADEALQLHGGYGYLAEYGIEKIVRDLRVHRILEGTNEIMRLIIARGLVEASH